MTRLLEEHARGSLREPADRRWSREVSHHLARQGYFQGQRVELIAGRIVQRHDRGSPPSVYRASAALLQKRLKTSSVDVLKNKFKLMDLV